MNTNESNKCNINSVIGVFVTTYNVAKRKSKLDNGSYVLSTVGDKWSL